MPEAGLLKRVKSWRSKRKGPQSSHLDALASPESQLNSAQSPSQEPPTNSSSPVLEVKPPADFAKRDGLDGLNSFIRARSDQCEWGQSEASSVIPSAAAGCNALPEGFGIELALGGPGESPLPRTTPKRVEGETSIPSSLIESPTIMRDNCSDDLAEQKRRRWRTFTGIFKKDFSSSLYVVGQKDHSDQKKPCKEMEQERGVSLWPFGSSHHSWDAEYAAGVPQAVSPPLQSLPRLEPLPGEDTGSRRQIGWRTSQFGRTLGKEGEKLTRNESRTWLLSHSSRKGPKPPPKKIITNRNASLSNPKNETLLQVEIPDFKMERYSVMFSNLLPRNQSLSLLARRQGHLAEIKLVPDERNKISSCSGDLELPQSDQQKSPYSPYILSCVPTASPTSVKSCTRSAPLGTSPIFHSHLAVDTSLVTDFKIEASESKGQSHLMVLVHTPADSLEEDASLDGSSSRSSPRLDILISPRSPSEGSSPEPAGSARSVATNLVMPTISLTPAPRQIARRNDARPSRCASHWVAFDKATVNHDAAEIAIARQVSVSKRQRQQLVPITARQVRPPKQPKLIDGEQDAKSRRSHYLTVEDR